MAPLGRRLILFKWLVIKILLINTFSKKYSYSCISHEPTHNPVAGGTDRIICNVLVMGKLILQCAYLTATEKQKHLGARFNRSGMDLNRASLTLPKKLKKPSPDTISLIDSASSMESLNTVGLLGSKQLSSSLLNINESGGK